MLKFKRPQKPKGFEKNVKEKRKEVEENVKSGEKPNFDALWKNYKEDLAKSQHTKCGYCETRIATDNGDVEHYAPKSQISEFKNVNPKTWGEEKKFLNNVKNRQLAVKCDSGYWWLAYEWNNYLLACSLCNRTWKRTLFPILEKRTDIPNKKDKETKLLLNPFDNIKPEQHFCYEPTGIIKAKEKMVGDKSVKSIYGFETIRTCGLDRNVLTINRKEKATLAFFKIKMISRESDKEKQLEYFRDIYNAGNEKYEYAGMVRIIFQQKTGIKWLELKELMNKNVIK